MTIEIACPTCSAKMKAPEAAAGRSVRCPKCGNKFTANPPGAAAPTPMAAELPNVGFDSGGNAFDFDDGPPVVQKPVTKGGRTKPAPAPAEADFADFDAPAAPVQPMPVAPAKRNPPPAPAPAEMEFDEVEEVDPQPQRRNARPRQSGGGIVDLLLLRRLITPWVVLVLYWLGTLLITLGALFAAAMSLMGNNSPGGGGGILYGGFILFIALPLALLMWRIYCEVFIVLFRISETLLDIRNQRH